MTSSGCAVAPETTLADDCADLAWLEGLNLNERAEPGLERAVLATTRWLRARPPWLLASGG